MKLLISMLLCVLVALGALAWEGSERRFAPLVHIAPSDAVAAGAALPVDDVAGTSMPTTRSAQQRTAAGTGPQPSMGTGPASPPVPASPIGAAAAAPAGLPAAADTTLLVPVQGVEADQLRDTFTDARSEGRSHDAIDIMAPTGTPVLAVADGHVEKLFDSQRGGLTVYQFEPTGRFAYYYAHLDRYAEGLAEGQAIRRGQVIGYVGATGNADPAAPHLHFAIFVLGPERRWWEGTAINPYPVLRGETPLP